MCVGRSSPGEPLHGFNPGSRARFNRDSRVNRATVVSPPYHSFDLSRREGAWFRNLIVTLNFGSKLHQQTYRLHRKKTTWFRKNTATCHLKTPQLLTPGKKRQQQMAMNLSVRKLQPKDLKKRLRD